MPESIAKDRVHQRLSGQCWLVIGTEESEPIEGRLVGRHPPRKISDFTQAVTSPGGEEAANVTSDAGNLFVPACLTASTPNPTKDAYSSQRLHYACASDLAWRATWDGRLVQHHLICPSTSQIVYSSFIAKTPSKILLALRP
jgi:hypothetical protein